MAGFGQLNGGIVIHAGLIGVLVVESFFGADVKTTRGELVIVVVGLLVGFVGAAIAPITSMWADSFPGCLPSKPHFSGSTILRRTELSV
jgi:hypothetical protein